MYLYISLECRIILKYVYLQNNKTFFISIIVRNNTVHDWVNRIEKNDGGLDTFSQAYKYYGIHFQQDNSVVIREWAPGAVQVYLTGDYSKYSLYIYAIFYIHTLVLNTH